MLLERVASTSALVAETSSRSAKIELLARLLRDCDEPAVVVAWLAGDLPQRQIGVGYAALRDLPAPASEATLRVAELNDRFDAIKACAGPGAQTQRHELLQSTFAAATGPEQDFLRRLLTGGLRQGALGAVMSQAIARAADVPADAVARAVMLRADLGAVATAALRGGTQALAEFGLQVGRPIGPMLAQSASDPAAALDRLGGTAAFEWKLDGARVQIHRRGRDVSVFTRSLDEVTSRLPELVERVAGLPGGDLILDGEAIALRADGRPHPFQVTASASPPGRGRRRSAR